MTDEWDKIDIDSYLLLDTVLTLFALEYRERPGQRTHRNLGLSRARDFDEGENTSLDQMSCDMNAELRELMGLHFKKDIQSMLCYNRSQRKRKMQS